jgi:adenylate kinase family enzyme
MRRVCVIGNSGSGKTSLAAALAGRIDAPHLVLDSVFHQADWQPLPDEEFRARVDEFTGEERSVIAWSITQHQDYRDMYADLEHDPQWSHAQIVRLRSRREVRDFRQTA